MTDHPDEFHEGVSDEAGVVPLLGDEGVVTITEGAPDVRHVDRTAVVDELMETSRLMVAIAARTVAQVDAQVSMPQFRLMVVLHLGGTQRVSDLATELGVHPSTAGRMVERLVAKGLITREEGQDRREILVALTPQGREFTADTTRRRREQFANLLDLFDDEQLAQIGRGMALLNAAHEGIGLTYAGEAGEHFTSW